jgi:hypothetical protein
MRIASSVAAMSWSRSLLGRVSRNSVRHDRRHPGHAHPSAITTRRAPLDPALGRARAASRAVRRDPALPELLGGLPAHAERARGPDREAAAADPVRAHLGGTESDVAGGPLSVGVATSGQMSLNDFPVLRTDAVELAKRRSIPMGRWPQTTLAAEFSWEGDVRRVGETALSLLDALSDQRLSRARGLPQLASRATAPGPLVLRLTTRGRREHFLDFRPRMRGNWVPPRGASSVEDRPRGDQEGGLVVIPVAQAPNVGLLAVVGALLGSVSPASPWYGAPDRRRSNMSTGESTGSSTEVPEVGTIDMALEVLTVYPFPISIGRSASIRAWDGGWTSTWSPATTSGWCR